MGVLEPSLGGLIAKLGDNLRTLIRQEIALARAELTANATRAARALVLLAGAAIVGVAALHGLLAAAALGLVAAGLQPWAAVGAVAVVALIVTLVLARTGMARLRGSQLAPRTTVDTLKESASVLRGTAQ